MFLGVITMIVPVAVIAHHLDRMRRLSETTAEYEAKIVWLAEQKVSNQSAKV